MNFTHIRYSQPFLMRSEQRPTTAYIKNNKYAAINQKIVIPKYFCDYKNWIIMKILKCLIEKYFHYKPLI